MSESIINEQARQAHDSLVFLGDLSVRFAGVERLICHPDGRAENDSEHSYHLAISAIEMASTYHPELDVGLVSQFCLVHDLPEIYAGDTPSFKLSDEERKEKETAENEAVDRLLGELPPYLRSLLIRYEDQIEPEARFVRFIDKLMPAIMHISAPDNNREVFFNRYGIETLEDLENGHEDRTKEVKEMFPEFKFMHIVRDLTTATARKNFFPGS